MKDLSQKLGRNATPEELEKYLESHNDKPSSKIKKVDQTMVNNAFKTLKDKLGRDPTP